MKRIALIFLLCAAALSLGAEKPAATTHPSADAMIDYLNRTVDWFRQVQSLAQSAGDSQEMLVRASLVQNTRQVVELGFKFAHAEQAILESQSRASGKDGGSHGRSIAQAADAAAERASQLQAKLQDLDQEISKTSGDALNVLYARRYELTAELNLANTQRDVLQEYAMFMTSTDTGDAAALSQKIDELERATLDATTQPAPASAAAAQQFHPDNAGIFSLVGEIMRLSSRSSEIKDLANEAANLRQTCDKFRAPMRDEAVDTMKISMNAVAATQPTTQDASAMEQRGIQIDQITDRFKDLSSASIPLAEQSTMLDASRDGLLSWRSAVEREQSTALRALALRIGTLVAIIVILFVISEVWRRATFKYIHDARRQRQLMVVRRIVIGFVVLIVIVASVVSEFGSLATFAGLITAGVAVALQTVILSGVAYFFFIGRFGVRVGDRVTIAGISGDVIEIGLFRIYLMELSGTKPDLHPTGRVVVFSNSVLFQPSAFYKQLPGSDYIWHEVAVTLAPNCDYKKAEERLLGAVNSVYAQYRDELERQHEAIERNLHVSMGKPQPEGRLRFVDAGLEFVVRYPVDIRHAADIDDHITRELLRTLNEEPKLEVVSGTPKIRTA